MSKTYKVAYVSRLIYPDPAANALQTIQMATALARLTDDVHLFIHDLTEPEAHVKTHYGVEGSALRIVPLKTQTWPAWMYSNAKARFLTYNSAVALLLGLSRAWRRAAEPCKVVFVRSRLEIVYWGLARRYLWWLRDWTFVCEVHDLPLPTQADARQPYDPDSARARRMVRALQQYDLVLVLTTGLDEDVRALSQQTVTPQIVPMATGLPRSEQPSAWQPSDRITLGYTGTIDGSHGITDLMEAMTSLPDRYVLRLVGRLGGDAEAYLEARQNDPALAGKIKRVPPVQYTDVAAEIDRCDIVLAPAGDTLHSRRYRSPLKLFDYMARGKPIVAAGVPGHLEVLHDGKNALIYKAGDPESLAACIASLVVRPRQAQAIARQAWQDSAGYTYEARARRVLELVDAVWEKRHTARSA